MCHYWLLTKKSPVLNTTCSLHMGYTGTMRDINIVELSPHRECPMRFFFQNGLQLCHISKETHAFWRSNKLFCNRKISAIQTKLNSWLRHETRSFCEGSVMHGPGEEVGVTGGPDSPWKQLSSTPTPGNVGPPKTTSTCDFFVFSYQINLKACINI